MNCRRAHQIVNAVVVTSMMAATPALAGGFPAELARVSIPEVQRGLQKFGLYMCSACQVDGQLGPLTDRAFNEFLLLRNLITPGAEISLGKINRDPDGVIRRAIELLDPNGIVDDHAAKAIAPTNPGLDASQQIGHHGADLSKLRDDRGASPLIDRVRRALDRDRPGER